jgi:hypothetical protein
MAEVGRKSFTARHLDPGSHMGEVLFGLIMTLTFTLAAGIVIQEEGRAGAREMLIGILGCNLAWGIIDGVLYVLGQVFERGRVRRLALNVRHATSPEQARAMVADEFDESLAAVSDEPTRHRLYQSIVEHVPGLPEVRNRVRRQDLMGGAGGRLAGLRLQFPRRAAFSDPRRTAPGAASVQCNPARPAVLRRLAGGAPYARQAMDCRSRVPARRGPAGRAGNTAWWLISAPAGDRRLG